MNFCKERNLNANKFYKIFSYSTRIKSQLTKKMSNHRGKHALRKNINQEMISFANSSKNHLETYFHKRTHN
jgi:hypothetical protein